jgi:hypothetical protein
VRRPALSETTEERARPVETKPAPGAADKPRGWRRWVPWLLIVVAMIIGLLAAVNVWVKRQALSTDNWTNASSRLLENDEIRHAVSVYLIDTVYQKVDVGKEISDRLPESTKALGPPVAAALEPQLVQATDHILGRPKVQELWKNANRRAHQAFINLLNGKTSRLQTTNGNVVLDLQPMLEEITKETGFGEKVVAKLPPDAGQIVVMKGNQLDAARKAVKVIRVMSFFLGFLVIAILAAAVYIARGRRRRMMLAAGVALLVVGFIVLIVRRFAGNYIVDALTTNPDDKHAVSASWAIGTELLRNVGFNILVYGIVIVFAAWIAGPSRPAVWVRRVSAPTMRDHPIVLYGVVALVLLLVLVSGPTDGSRVYPLLVLFALAFVGTEVLRRQTLREFPASEPALTPSGAS